MIAPGLTRVEGRGSATIHDVTLGDVPKPLIANTSAALKALLAEEAILLKSLDRTKLSVAALATYLGSLNIQHLEPSNLGAVLDSFRESGRKLDEELLSQDRELEELAEKVLQESSLLSQPSGDVRLRKQVSVGVFADGDVDVEIAVIYGAQT